MREALAHDAPDAAIVAYARSQDYVLVTHDREIAVRAQRAELPHVWLRMPEVDDAAVIEATIGDVEEAIAAGQIRVVIGRAGML